jgi:hypothetical protein
VPSAEQYEATLAAQRISLHLQQRSDAIWAAVQAEAAAVGGVIPDSARADLLQEVANLVESPTVVRWGSPGAVWLEEELHSFSPGSRAGCEQPPARLQSLP